MKPYRNLGLSLTAVLLAFLLTACGFKLRGGETLPLALHSIYLPLFPADVVLHRELSLALQTRQVAVTDSVKEAPFSLYLLSSSFNQTLTSTSTDMQLRNYLLIYNVEYQVKSADGKTLIPATTLTLTRNYTASITQMLNDSGEYSHVRQVLRQDAIKQMIERLRYLKLKAHANKP